MGGKVSVVLFAFGVMLFVLGVVGVVLSEHTVRGIQLCWSPECSREFIDALWRSVALLLQGVINMLLGVALVTLAVTDMYSS
jgi:hypothetical protein